MAEEYALSFYLPPFEDADGPVLLLQESVSQEFVEETGMKPSESLNYDDFLRLREDHHQLFRQEDLEKDRFGLFNYLGREMTTYGAEMGYLSREEYRNHLQEIDERGITPSNAEEAKDRDWVRNGDLESFEEDLEIVLEEI